MIQCAILKSDRLLPEKIETSAVAGDAVCVFTTDGIQVHGKCYGQKGVFYQNDKTSLISFYSDVMAMLGEKLYELAGRDELIRMQNATLLKLTTQSRAEETRNGEKNV